MCQTLIELQQEELQARSMAVYRPEMLSDPEFSIWNLTEIQRWKAYTSESQQAILAVQEKIKQHVLGCTICKQESPEMFVYYGGDLGTTARR